MHSLLTTVHCSLSLSTVDCPLSIVHCPLSRALAGRSTCLMPEPAPPLPFSTSSLSYCSSSPSSCCPEELLFPQLPSEASDRRREAWGAGSWAGVLWPCVLLKIHICWLDWHTKDNGSEIALPCAPQETQRCWLSCHTKDSGCILCRQLAVNPELLPYYSKGSQQLLMDQNCILLCSKQCALYSVQCYM